MLLDVVQLKAFYASALGQSVRWAIGRQLLSLWPDRKGMRLLGVGYAQPYLKTLGRDAERVVAFMSAVWGVEPWPVGRPVTVLGEEASLPFAEAFFDRIVVVHGLEGAENVRVLLRQIWRVLAPEGRMIVVAPNRVSLWSLTESSPFGCGRPFRRNELTALLQETMFEPLSCQRALYMPPLARHGGPRKPVLWEALGTRLYAGGGGVLIVEVKKTLYGVTPLSSAKKTETVFVHA